MSLADTARMIAELTFKDRMTPGVNKATKSIDGLERKLGTMDKVGMRAQQGLRTTGQNLMKMSKFAAVAAGGLVVGSIKVAADFDDQMTKSLAIQVGVTDEMRENLETAAREVAKTTTFSASQAAEAYFFLASAGLDASQQLEAMPKVAKFAQAGNFDLATATDLLTDAQSALGLTIRDDAVKNMENMIRVSDVLVKANTLSNATVEQFSQSLTEKAGAAMRKYQIDIESGAAVLAVFADAGVKGTKAGNTFTSTIEGLALAAVKNKKAFKEYGLEVFDARGRLLPMVELTENLTKAFAGMSDEQRTFAFKQLGVNKLTSTGVGLLLGNAEALGKYEEELRKAGGTTETVATKQLESLSAQFAILKNNITDVGITVGSKLLPKLTPITQKLVKKIQENGPAIDDFADSLAGAFDKALLFAERIPWAQIGAGLETASFFAGKLFDAFLNLPPDVQTTLIALAGLNKLSGGAITGIAGELGKGLIKGVLGMNAGVVNLNAGVVNGAGGVGGAGAAAGASRLGQVGNAVKIIGSVAIAAASIYALGEEFGRFQNKVADAQGALADKVATTINQNFDQTIANLKATADKISSKNVLERAVIQVTGLSELQQNFDAGANRIVQAQNLTHHELAVAKNTLISSRQALVDIGGKTAAVDAAIEQVNAKLAIQNVTTATQAALGRVTAIANSIKEAQAAQQAGTTAATASRSAGSQVTAGGHSDASRIAAAIWASGRANRATISSTTIHQTNVQAQRGGERSSDRHR